MTSQPPPTVPDHPELVATNRWDPAVLERFRKDPVVSGFAGGIDSTATAPQLEHIATLLLPSGWPPAPWVPPRGVPWL